MSAILLIAVFELFNACCALLLFWALKRRALNRGCCSEVALVTVICSEQDNPLSDEDLEALQELYKFGGWLLGRMPKTLLVEWRIFGPVLPRLGNWGIQPREKGHDDFVLSEV